MILALTGRTFPAMIGYSATVATVLGIFDYTGARLTNDSVDPNVDEFDRRMALRNNYRSPGEETLAELGEGRGKMNPIHYIGIYAAI